MTTHNTAPAEIEEWTEVPNALLLNREMSCEDRMAAALLCSYADANGQVTVEGQTFTIPAGPRTAIPLALIGDRRLSADARLLGMLLFLRAGQGAPTLVSQAELTYLLRCTPSDLSRWLHQVRVAGWMAVIKSEAQGPRKNKG